MRAQTLMALALLHSGYAITAEPPALPAISWSSENFEYMGAFGLPGGDIGVSTFTGSSGTIGLGETKTTMYMSGRTKIGHDGGIAEVEIPTLSQAALAKDLPKANVVQSFNKLSTNSQTGNPQKNDTYTGIYSHNGQLIVNAIEIYDGNSANTHFSLVASQADDFVASTIKGYFELEGRARAAGWISDVPAQWQSALGCEHLMGNSSGYSIISRLSVGPSAYCVDLDEITSHTDLNSPVSSTVLMSYDLDNKLPNNINPDWDLHNTLDRDADPIIPQTNDIWTHLSKGGFGFIIPGTDTYAVFGSSAGHATGLGYKITQDTGKVCGGHCPPDSTDWSHFRWFYKVSDLVKVKNGELAPHELVPYEYGPIDTPFETNEDGIPSHLGGGAYDAEAGILYLGQTSADRSGFNNLPAVLAYKINVPSLPKPPTNLSISAE